QYNLLRNEWNEFINTDKNSDKLVLIEGGTRKLYTNIEETTHYDAEGGYISWLANEQNIPIESAEPQNELFDLMDKYDKDVIAYYYFARTVMQWSNFRSNKPTFESYVQRILDKEAKRFKELKP